MCFAIAIAAIGTLVGACKPSEPETSAEALLPDHRGLEVWRSLLPELRAVRLDDHGRPSGDEAPLLELAPTGGPVILALWATYCAPCLADIPVLDRLHASGPAKVVGVSMDGKDALPRLRARIEEAGARYPNVLLTRASIERAGLALDEGLPFTLVLDRQGRAAEVLRGVLTRARLDAALTRLDAPR